MQSEFILEEQEVEVEVVTLADLVAHTMRWVLPATAGMSPARGDLLGVLLPGEGDGIEGEGKEAYTVELISVGPSLGRHDAVWKTVAEGMALIEESR